jgi:hypothetical protein
MGVAPFGVELARVLLVARDERHWAAPRQVQGKCRAPLAGANDCARGIAIHLGQKASGG